MYNWDMEPKKPVRDGRTERQMSQANDPVIRQLVEDAIDEKINSGDMFTAFNITRAVRSDGTRARHEDVKSVVHQIFNSGKMGNYTRSQINVAGANIQPFLYHPVGADITEYDPGADRPQKPAHAPAPTSTPSDPADDDSDDGILRRTGREGYLYIPGVMVRDIGLNKSEKAHVYRSGSQVLISKSDDVSKGTLLGIYSVDVKGNVRLHANQLPSGGPNYRVKVSNGDVVVE